MFIIINICSQSASVAINSTLICFLISPKKLPAIWEIQSSVFQALARHKVLQTRQKLLQNFFSYELTCNVFLPIFWILSELAAGRPETESTFWDYFCFEVLQVWRETTFTLGCYIFLLYLFSNQLGFLQKTELSFSFPFVEGHIYILIQEGCHLERVKVLGARLQHVWLGQLCIF